VWGGGLTLFDFLKLLLKPLSEQLSLLLPDFFATSQLRHDAGPACE
jgi:hypothetical protein